MNLKEVLEVCRVFFLGGGGGGPCSMIQQVIGKSQVPLEATEVGRHYRSKTKPDPRDC